MSVPDYYKITLPERADNTYDPMDVIDALDLNFNLGSIMKYVCRAGLKPGESRSKDLHKALHCLQREIAYRCQEKGGSA